MGIIPNGEEGITPGPIQEATGVTGGVGIQRLATLDQPQAENMLKQMFVLDNLGFNDVLSIIYNGLRQGVSMALAIVEAVVKNITGLSPETIFLSIEHALTTLQGWGNSIGQALSDLGTALSQIGEAFKGNVIDPITDAVEDIANGIASFFGFRSDTINKFITQQEFTITATSGSAGRTAGWAARYAAADSVFPEMMLYKFPTWGATESGGTDDHIHDIDGNNAEAHASWWNTAPGTTRGGQISITASTVMTHIAVNMRHTGTAPGSDVYLELWRQTPDGGTKRLFSEDIGPLIVSGDGTYIERELDSPTIVQDGEIFIVTIRNASAVTIGAAGLERQGGVFYRGFWVNSAADTATHDSTATAAAKQATDVAMWAMICRPTDPPQDRTWSDNFNRTTVGLDYVTAVTDGASDDMAIVDNQLAYGDGPAGTKEALYVKPCGSIEMRLDVDVSQVANMWIGIGYDRERSAGVGVHLTPISARIVTFGPDWATPTQRSVIAIGGNGQWSIYYNDAENTYTVLKDGDDVGLSWEDTGNVVPHNSDQLYAMVRIPKSGATEGGRVDNLVFRDWHGD